MPSSLSSSLDVRASRPGCDCRRVASVEAAPRPRPRPCQQTHPVQGEGQVGTPCRPQPSVHQACRPAVWWCVLAHETHSWGPEVALTLVLSPAEGDSVTPVFLVYPVDGTSSEERQFWLNTSCLV